MAINSPRAGQRRDTQRSKVYAAERVITVHPGRGRCPDPKLAEIADCQAYVDRLTGSAWYRRTFPDHAGRPVIVRHGGGARYARASGSRMIQLPAWARQRSVILHELAHLINYVTDPRAAWHGWEFCAIYVQLVRHELGVDAEAKLKASFRWHRVKFRAPRKMSEEQRAAAAERLAGFRVRSSSRAAACVPPDRDHDVALARANE